MTARRCAGCGRPLTVSSGPYGPVCARRLGLTTGRRPATQTTARPTATVPPGQTELPLTEHRTEAAA